jgi:demethylmenaquinone methyltransferase / 2-methoxy-6-polyprenyl-1,4-benzoquinol methylase
MGSVFYSPGRERANKVRDLFGLVADRYDLINDLQSLGLHRGWKDRVVEVARVRPGESALDVCCGTGDIAFRLARAGARVTGLDFSQPMLDLAEARKAGSPGRDYPQFMRADALSMPFGEDSFDVVTAGYGLRNLASMQAGLAEMVRVAKCGGRLVVLDFGVPNHPLWRVLTRVYLRTWVPLWGLIFCGSASAYSYIYDSLKDYPAQQGLARAMAALGLQDIQTIDLVGGAMSITVAVKIGNC